MPLTNLTFVANPRFAAPRSYWRGILIGYGPAAIVTFATNIIQVHENIGGPNYIDTYITLDPRFVPWSSNNWTLDHIFVDVFSSINSGPPVYFAGQIDCGILSPSAKFGAGLTFSGATTTYLVFLEPAPPGYWLPELP